MTYKIDGIEITDDQLDELNRQRKRKPWEPKDREDYWCVHGNGNIKKYEWCKDKCDNLCLEMGNVFKTEEEAENHVKKIESIQHGELKGQLTDGFYVFFPNKYLEYWKK